MKEMMMKPARSPDGISGTAEEMFRLIRRLYPICRSITGNGVRETLKILQEYVPLIVHEVPSGTQVFDWSVPNEWNVRDAYIKNSKGEKIVDFRNCNLHVLNYSAPIRKKVSLEELKAHTFTAPEQPGWIPYRTSYYKENWGFCLSHNQLSSLTDDTYEVFIDTSLQSGHLTYGEYFLRGQTDDEVLISTHICHPSLANDNLSGIALAVFIAKQLSHLSSRYSYRFLFTPGTIGSITWLSLNESQTVRIKHGLVLACVGDSGQINYKKSRHGNAEVDRAVIQVLKDSGDPYQAVAFAPYGYDERQFCSPGFDLPVGCFMRTPHGEFPEYHTSADNLDFIRLECLADSFIKCRAILDVLERNRSYLNLNPKCEPQLGKRGIYGHIGGQKDGRLQELAMLWVLNLSDGNSSLLDIAEKSGLLFDTINGAAKVLLEHGLLKESSASDGAVGPDCRESKFDEKPTEAKQAQPSGAKQ
jgi:aminopeptidase-like protein